MCVVSYDLFEGNLKVFLSIRKAPHFPELEIYTINVLLLSLSLSLSHSLTHSQSFDIFKGKCKVVLVHKEISSFPRN